MIIDKWNDYKIEWEKLEYDKFEFFLRKLVFFLIFLGKILIKFYKIGDENE